MIAPATRFMDPPAIVGIEPRDQSPLRVCMLASCPFPANHGTPGSIREMAEGLTELGQEIHIVTYHFGESIPVDGPSLHRITPWTKESKVVVGPTIRRPLYDLQIVFKALEVIREHRAHVIHAHGYEAALAGAICRFLTGVPMLYSSHNTMSDELPAYDFIRPKWLAVAFARLLDAFVPRLGDRCLPHSRNIEAFLHNMGLRERCEPTINFGIDLSWADHLDDGAALRVKHGFGADPVILYAGVMDRFQRLDILLEAFQKVLAVEPRARLLMVVTVLSDKHIATVRRQAEELGVLDRMTFTEPQNLFSAREYLPVCDVAVVPRPAAPGFPIKLLNYMAAGKPAVLFESSSSDLAHGEIAYLVHEDTPEALAQGLLATLRDPGLRKRLGMNGQRFVRDRHDRRVTARQLLVAYRHTLAACGRKVHDIRTTYAAPRELAVRIEPREHALEEVLAKVGSHADV